MNLWPSISKFNLNYMPSGFSTRNDELNKEYLSLVTLVQIGSAQLQESHHINSDSDSFLGERHYSSSWSNMLSRFPCTCNHIEIPRLKSRPLFPTNHKSDCNYHGPEAGHSTLNCKCIPTKWAVPSDAYPNCFVSVNTGKPTKAMKIYMEKEQQPKVEGKQSKGKGSKRLVEEIKAEPADNTNNDRKRVRFLNARIEP